MTTNNVKISGNSEMLFSHEQLEVLASGKVSTVFGSQFTELDQYHRQVRLPQPPLLLVDRVMKIEGEACSMKKGIAPKV